MFATALQYHQAGKLAEAEQVYRQVLALNPQHADTLHLLGMIGFQCGHLDAASQLIQQAISLHPEIALYHSNLGVVRNAQGHPDRAAESYLQAIALKADHFDAHHNLGIVLNAQGKFTEAIVHLKRALELNPKHAHSHVNLGVGYAEQGDFINAITHYERAIALDSECAEAHSNLGNALQTQNKLDEAIACYQRALALKPDYLHALYNCGNIYQALNKPGEAVACYDRALAIQPDYAQAQYGKALAQLLEGDFANGWQSYEIRWQTAAHRPMRRYAQPRWQGNRLETGSLLIWPEQGIGDEIMFAGLIPDVVRTGNSVILECDARLKPLFARSLPSVQVISGAEELPFEAHEPIGSLARFFRSTEQAFQATTWPYLFADSDRQRAFRARYRCGRRLAGLAWHTRNLKTGFSRSIDLRLFLALFRRDDISWISLQYGDHDALERSAEVEGAPLTIDRSVDQLVDMDGFAAQIAALDLVITIDNSTAHLAGALGVPVWLLLPFARDWRWFQERQDSPWYPSMRIFRQPKNGDWQSVIHSVMRALDDSSSQ